MAHTPRMAGSGLIPGAETCTLLDWDTRHFGVRIARVNRVHPTEQTLGEIDAWCRANRVDCLYYLGESTSGDNLLAAYGYEQIDVRVTLEWLPPQNLPRLGENTDVTTRRATESDLSILRGLVRSQTWTTRFAVDSRFDQGRVKDLYVEWLNRSFDEDGSHVMLAEHGGEVAGLVTASMRVGEGSIDLVCCADGWERQGVTTLLVVQTMAELAEKGCQTVRVVTQERNARALSLYKRCGFAVVESRPWLHKWFR